MEKKFRETTRIQSALPQDSQVVSFANWTVFDQLVEFEWVAVEETVRFRLDFRRTPFSSDLKPLTVAILVGTFLSQTRTA